MANRSNTRNPEPRNCQRCEKPLTREQLVRHASRPNPPSYCSRECFLATIRKPKKFGPPRPRRVGPTHSHNRGGKHSPTYTAWHSMKQRCLNPNNANFHHYGGRGIMVCERWLDFAHFLEDMGVRPDGTSLDRIDTDGNYEPGNCRWATAKEQCNNWQRKHQFIVKYKGEEYTLQTLADHLGLDRYTLRRRVLTSRWPEEMWHLPPNRQLRPNRRVSQASQKQNVLPRGQTDEQKTPPSPRKGRGEAPQSPDAPANRNARRR